jgi:hypothetical protein
LEELFSCGKLTQYLRSYAERFVSFFIGVTDVTGMLENTWVNESREKTSGKQRDP